MRCFNCGNRLVKGRYICLDCRMKADQLGVGHLIDIWVADLARLDEKKEAAFDEYMKKLPPVEDSCE